MGSTLSLTAAGIALAVSLVFAQPPEAGAGGAPKQERNLQVFPQAIPQERLMAAMQGFSRALGVSCSHCHVPGNFRSDDNPNKNVARGMMRMTRRINAELLPAALGAQDRAGVSCSTCHRGQATPETVIPDDSTPDPRRSGERG